MAIAPNAVPDRPGAREDTSAEPASPALVGRLRRQLASSEETATIGRMTAGIAQEIDAPLASLLGSLSQMTELLGNEAGPASPDDVARLRDTLRSSASIVDRIKDLVGAIRA